MHRALTLGMIAGALATVGCTQARSESGGPIVGRDYKVGEFNRIDLGGAYDLTVRTGSAPTVHARGGQNVIDKLEVEVRGDTLVIRPKKKGLDIGWNSHGKVELTVTVPALRAASLAGAGDIRIDRVAGDSFEGSIAGSGDLRLDKVEVATVKFDISGAGSVNVTDGRARHAEYGITGAGDIHAKGLTSETASISIAGAGGVQASATKTANVSIVGAGDVNLAGGAKCSVSKVGAGDVHCS
jgi:hypothetical protein